MVVEKSVDPGNTDSGALDEASFRTARRDDSAPYLFGAGVQKASIVYVAVVVVASFVVGLFVHSKDGFLLAWAATAALGIVPATVAAGLAAQRSAGALRSFWRLWFGGLVAADLCLASVLVAVVLDSATIRAIAGICAFAAAGCWSSATGGLLRSRSGRLSVRIDILDVAIALVVIVAPAGLALFGPAVRSSEPWFTVLVLIAACLLPASIVAAGVLFVRTPAGDRVPEVLGMVLGVLSTISAWLLVAQGVSDFTLPSAPLLAIQMIDMGLLFVQPLFSPRRDVEGLDRFSAAGQIRKWSVATILVAVGVPVLLVATWALHDEVSGAFAYSMVVFAMLLGMATLRHALMVRETRGLYAEIERVSEERKALLSSLMRAVEQDRHRVASQLHEEAIASLAALGMIMQTSYAALPPDVSGPLNDALTDIRVDLAARAESLRELMLAVRSPGLDDESLATSFLVLTGELYGETAAPQISIDIDPQLVLDWTTKTIVYRIAQEAIHNTWRHAHAKQLDISLQWVDETIVFLVEDDGVGFDPGGAASESGIATMRLFAGLGQGTVLVERGPHGGTRVLAVLGQAHEVLGVDEPSSRPRLHVISGDVEDLTMKPRA